MLPEGHRVAPESTIMALANRLGSEACVMERLLSERSAHDIMPLSGVELYKILKSTTLQKIQTPIDIFNLPQIFRSNIQIEIRLRIH